MTTITQNSSIEILPNRTNILKPTIVEFNEKNNIIALFKKIKIDYSWSFSDKTRKDTAYITHGYHRYPAKFIPQIVSRLADKYTKEGLAIIGTKILK